MVAWFWRVLRHNRFCQSYECFKCPQIKSQEFRNIYSCVWIMKSIDVKYWDDVPINILCQIHYFWISWGQKFIDEPGSCCRRNPFSSVNIRFDENGRIALYRIQFVSFCTHFNMYTEKKSHTYIHCSYEDWPMVVTYDIFLSVWNCILLYVIAWQHESVYFRRYNRPHVRLKQWDT